MVTTHLHLFDQAVISMIGPDAENEYIFLSMDKTLRAVLDHKKGILSFFITNSNECIWSGQSNLFVGARTCHFNVDGEKIEFTSAKNEGWLFDIKTKKCFNVLNDKVENINHSGKNRLGNNQNVNKHHTSKNRNKVHSSTYESEARIKMHEKPRRPSTMLGDPRVLHIPEAVTHLQVKGD